MYRQNQTLVDLLHPVVTAMGYELWGIEQLSEGHATLLRVYIEHESGITLEDCTRVSRQVAAVLDVEDPVAGAYRLEISSPGLDRPLFTLDHFSRFIGEQVRVHLRQKFEDRKRISGQISHIEDDKVTIDSDGTEYTISASLIEKANLLPFLKTHNK
jgi:ribosome maturation factor RimP